MATCYWIDDDGPWQPACASARLFEFNDGGPVENGFEFCPYCGNPLEERRVERDEDDEALSIEREEGR